MSKRTARKDAYRMIVKENRSLQETYDSLSETTGLDSESLAEIIAAVPSQSKRLQLKNLVIIYVVLMSIFGLLRLVGVVAILQLNVNPVILILALAIGLLLPVGAIFCALTWRLDGLRTFSILLIIALVRSFTSQQIELDDPFALGALAIVAGAVVIGFILQNNAKTDYRSVVEEVEVDGKWSKRKVVKFKEEVLASDNLLDL